MQVRIISVFCIVAFGLNFSGYGQTGSLKSGEPLSGTELLDEKQPLDELMVSGIDRFALRAIEDAASHRRNSIHGLEPGSEDFSSKQEELRVQFATLIGAIDERVKPQGIEIVSTTTENGVVAENDQVSVLAVRWKVLEGMDASGLLIRPVGKDIVARVVAIPDADWTPEMISGIQPGTVGEESKVTKRNGGGGSGARTECTTEFALSFALMGCEVLVPTLVDRDTRFSRNDEIGRSTNLSHREFVYRQAFELGRHVIGFEVQKVLAAVDQFRSIAQTSDLPIVVAGVSEGGLLALYSAAIDSRIDAAIVSGYFDQREGVWKEPIYRNVWGLLKHHGDAELAAMIAPRRLFIEAAPMIPEVSGPAEANRNVAAPGTIVSPSADSVLLEVKRARKLVQEKSIGDRIVVLDGRKPGSDPLQFSAVKDCLDRICGNENTYGETNRRLVDQRKNFSAVERQRVQIEQMVGYTQNLLRKAHRQREKRFSHFDRSSPAAFDRDVEQERVRIHEELFGRLPKPTSDPRPRTRLVIEATEMRGYEVVLDVYPDVIASGILLLPSDLKDGEKRPVVVCQHGLEGTPMDTIGGPQTSGYRAYKGFAAELCRRGFIVYAPQNPYRGGDRFRTLQRKSNVLGRSLFSYIIPQHLVALRWLSELPNVDPERIGFYGLSYGGKTAVRVPPMLPPTEDEPGYCLSICSADFNEWVAKNVSVDAPFSYLWTGEYEIFEWNMGHVANYAELSILMTPRPFMVERGHDDGVGIDEWVAWEFAKVRRHYNKLGIGHLTEIEFFDGPHTINGDATYRFLHRHLQWPERKNSK